VVKKLSLFSVNSGVDKEALMKLKVRNLNSLLKMYRKKLRFIENWIIKILSNILEVS